MLNTLNDLIAAIILRRIPLGKIKYRSIDQLHLILIIFPICCYSRIINIREGYESYFSCSHDNPCHLIELSQLERIPLNGGFV